MLNLVLPTELTLDRNKQLTFGDVKVEQDGLLIHLKWAKNLQRSYKYYVLKIPRIPGRPMLCPFCTFHMILNVDNQGPLHPH